MKHEREREEEKEGEDQPRNHLTEVSSLMLSCSNSHHERLAHKLDFYNIYTITGNLMPIPTARHESLLLSQVFRGVKSFYLECYGNLFLCINDPLIPTQ